MKDYFNWSEKKVRNLIIYFFNLIIFGGANGHSGGSKWTFRGVTRVNMDIEGGHPESIWTLRGVTQSQYGR